MSAPIPGPLIGGTAVFALLACACGGAGAYLRRIGRFDKDASQIFCVSVFVGFVCVWTMWVCTWLHQWHPIIYPIVSHQPGASAAAHGGGSGGGNH